MAIKTIFARKLVMCPIFALRLSPIAKQSESESNLLFFNYPSPSGAFLTLSKILRIQCCEQKWKCTENKPGNLPQNYYNLPLNGL